MATNICSYMKKVKSSYNTRRNRTSKLKESATTAPQPCSFGYFSCLPKEMRFSIFSKIPLVELGNLSLTSHSLRDAVLEYIRSKEGLVKILPRVTRTENKDNYIAEVIILDDAMKYSDHFEDLGVLLKKVSCLFSTMERLKEVGIALDKLKDTHSVLCSQFSSDFAYSCYGSFLRSFIAGWEDDEKMRAYQAIKDASCLEERLDKVLHSSPGTYPWFEKYIRVFYREIFLNKSFDETDRGFWLSTILKPWPIVFQARILYLLYGPYYRDTGLIHWSILSTCSTFYGVEDAEVRELADAIVLLRTQCKYWNEDSVISIVEELTAISSDWCLENIAKLLVLCGEDVTYSVMGSKAVNGRVHELAYMGYYVTQAAGRYDMGRSKSRKLDSFMGLIKRIVGAMPGYKNKVSFTMALFNVWEENIISLTEDIQDDSDQDGIPEEQEQALVETIHNLCKVSTYLLKESINK